MHIQTCVSYAYSGTGRILRKRSIITGAITIIFFDTDPVIDLSIATALFRMVKNDHTHQKTLANDR